MKVQRIVSVVVALAFPFGAMLIAGGSSGCGSKETDGTTGAPAPPPPPPTPTQTTVMTPEEDAGAPVDASDDADADAPKPTGNFDPTGIKACCAALAQNAASAPLDQKPMYLQAAAVCQGLVNNPQGRQALSQLRGILRGANMPSSCK
jgi:hypothetical protein